MEEEPSKGVKRKAEEPNGADASEQKEEPPAKDAKSEEHATAGVHAFCLGLFVDHTQITTTPPVNVTLYLIGLRFLMGPSNS